ncbi:MAG: hypothetical protein NZ811_03420 [Gammaproteobacteria bacterium]|nr:hypothetical protein [Gammaproteobacteria bacterium]
MTEQTQTINLNDKEYNIDDLSDKARYIISQLQDLNQQSLQLKAKLDQVEVASKGFTNLLVEEVEKPEEE